MHAFFVNSEINPLQYIQNSFDSNFVKPGHIIPVLKSIHWLKVYLPGLCWDG